MSSSHLHSLNKNNKVTMQWTLAILTSTTTLTTVTTAATATTITCSSSNAYWTSYKNSPAKAFTTFAACLRRLPKREQKWFKKKKHYHENTLPSLIGVQLLFSIRAARLFVTSSSSSCRSKKITWRDICFAELARLIGGKWSPDGGEASSIFK